MITQIKIIKERLPSMKKMILNYGDPGKIGSNCVKMRLKLLECVVMPTILYNVETWTEIRKDELRELESIQGQLLRTVFDQKANTSYYGLSE